MYDINMRDLSEASDFLCKLITALFKCAIFLPMLILEALALVVGWVLALTQPVLASQWVGWAQPKFPDSDWYRQV
jgi:hypothetical protein